MLLIQQCYLKDSTYSNFFTTTFRATTKFPVQAHALHLVVMLLRLSFIWSCPSAFVFQDIDVLKSQRCCFIECLMLPHSQIQVTHLGQEYDISHAVFSRITSPGLLLLCPVIGDVRFDHSVKVQSTRFPHCKGIFPPLYLVCDLWGVSLIWIPNERILDPLMIFT